MIRRKRKGGHFILTAGFPENRLEQVQERILRAGGIVTDASDAGFVFSGIDGSIDETLVSDESRRDRNVPESVLREMILAFDLSHSTPMDAMIFVDKLQKMYINN